MKFVHKNARNVMGTGKFAPKLTFEQQCEIWFFKEFGIPASVISRIYPVNLVTINKIARKSAPVYKKVREHCEKLGINKVRDLYVSENRQDQMKAELEKTHRMLSEVPPAKHRRASRRSTEDPYTSPTHAPEQPQSIPMATGQDIPSAPGQSTDRPPRGRGRRKS